MEVSSSGQLEITEVGVLNPSDSSRPPEHGVVSNLPEHKVRDLTEAFKMFDLNGDGKISRVELGTVLRSLGETMTDSDLEQMIKDVDTNGDGEIDLQEFIHLNADHRTSTRAAAASAAAATATSSSATAGDDQDDGVSETEALQSAFDVFDSDNDGFISAGELHKVLSGLGDDRISLDDCRYMISCVDLDGDQLVDFTEFQTLMAGNPAH